MGRTGRCEQQLGRRLRMRAVKPHYVRGYQDFTRDLLLSGVDEDEAVLLAVGGGAYEAHGDVLREVVIAAGLEVGDTLVDVGCGAGRLPWALSRSRMDVAYLGTDVVPDLLSYARRKCGRPDWEFRLVDDLSIPAGDAEADLVTFFSVFTHLDPAEQATYLEEARRVVRPGGSIVVSYIELWRWSAWRRLRFRLSALKYFLFRKGIKSLESSDAKMRALGEDLDMDCTLLGPVIGQSVCVYRPRARA